MSAPDLAAVVEQTRAEATIGSLRNEGVYDDQRSVHPLGDDAVAIPVTAPPAHTTVREVIRDTDPRPRPTLDSHLRERGWTAAERDRAPSSWAQIGTVILVDIEDVPRPTELGEALLALHGGADTVCARHGISGPHREPDIEVIVGEGDTETVHTEHGTEYALDLSELMFSPGNKAERTRMGEIVSSGEAVLDMFAGIGYFTLPMARSGATVTAIERNPTAFEYLLENVVRNGVTDRVQAYRADCDDVLEAMPDSFERIVLGHYDAHDYLPTAIARLCSHGTLHHHEVTPKQLVPDRPIERIQSAATEAGRTIETVTTRTVKSYSEGVDHVVADATLA